ncbi:MAG: adenylate/guanylate cyclase domain-containing protein [Lachnospiraceae bacterium]|nr:adenylate/guanylate cyclase domain-containing protein [Lachnospiraceae bacterium]
MKKDVWVLCNSREDMIEAQRRINEGGGLKAFCLLHLDAVRKAAQRALETNTMPSLLLVDYESGCREEFESIRFLLSKPAFVGIPLFFMASVKEKEIDEKCYELGATVVLHKPFSGASMLRIERAALQNEMTRNYEKIVQRQTMELAAAKEIKRLNEQLSVRNELLRQILGKYFSDEVVDVILERPEGAAIGGEKRIVTVMMADLRGFTALSERLSADEVIAILNHYLEKMTEVIMKYGGTIIEFIGDAILAVFGAPLVAEHAADDAVAAAIEMQNCMESVNRYNTENGYPKIETGIGIHAGETFIGNIGSEKFMRYNVIGQVVNLCSRIQTYSIGGQILVSEQTTEYLTGELLLNKKFEISMKGVHETLMVCDVRMVSGVHEARLSERSEEIVPEVRLPIPVMLYLLQGKSVIRGAVEGNIFAISEHKVHVICKEEYMHEFSLYQDTEIVLGHENAYAKILGIEGNRLYLYFTFLSEHFLETCGYAAKEGNE